MDSVAFSEIIVKGKPACKGIAVGKARIILSPDEGSILKKGDILITKMTTPDYTIFLHRVAAIVTDEGGLTCHAAIVSRELGIPCVTGTGNATRLIVDGEMIRIDANRGIIYRSKTRPA